MVNIFCCCSFSSANADKNANVEVAVCGMSYDGSIMTVRWIAFAKENNGPVRYELCFSMYDFVVNTLNVVVTVN